MSRNDGDYATGTNRSFMFSACCSAPAVRCPAVIVMVHIRCCGNVFPCSLTESVDIRNYTESSCHFYRLRRNRRVQNTHLLQTPGCIIKFSCNKCHRDKPTKTQSGCLAFQTIRFFTNVFPIAGETRT